MKTYAVKKVAVSFNGQILSGFMAGTFVEIAFDSDAFAKDTGSQGEVSRVALADEGATIKITLQQTSASNDVLSAALANDRLTQNGTGVIFIKDTSGRTVAQGAEAWVKKSADVKFTNGAEGREWTIDTGILKMTVGGN